jgi:hypothetical protein
MQQEITLNLCTNSNEFKQVLIYFLQKSNLLIFFTKKAVHKPTGLYTYIK